MKESEMFQRILTPIIDEMGLARATAAMEAAKPFLEAIGKITDSKSITKMTELDATFDALRVTELWCKSIREIAKEEDNEFPDTIGGD